MSKLQGKTAIVTGATSGMGRATALLFAREGAAVVASGRHSERGLALVDEIRAGGGRAEFVPGDVSLPETNERLVAECRRAFGGVDTAVCCAGMLGLGSATEVAVETWKQTLAVNLDAVFYLLRSALPALQERGGGSIVVVGSIAAFKGFPNHAAYCASKGALVALVRQVAIDYGPRGPRQPAVSRPRGHASHLGVRGRLPGPVEGRRRRREEDRARAVGSAGGHRRRGALPRLRRLGWVTGTTLTVDGGIMTGA